MQSRIDYTIVLKLEPDRLIEPGIGPLIGSV